MQGSCPFSFYLFLSFFFCGFVNSLNPSGEILSLAPARGLRLQWLVPVEAGPSPLTYVLLQGIFFAFMASLVTYIRLSGILSLSFYNLVPVGVVVSNLHPSRRNLVTLVCLIPIGVVVSNLHPSRRNLVTLVCLIPIGVVVSNLHPSRRNLVTLFFLYAL